MRSDAHEELEQLSALLDGELAEHERTRLEAHVSSCAECRSVLDALQATLSDLRALEQPEPSPQTSWALRGAIRRARRPRRWQVAALATGSAAAALIGVLAVVVQQDGGRPPELAGGDARVQTHQIAPELAFADYTPDALRARAADLAGGQSEERKAEQGAGTAAAAPMTTADASGCMSQIKDAEKLELLAVEHARFEGEEAVIYVFRATKRIEIWVYSPSPCTFRFFTQAAIPQ